MKNENAVSSQIDGRIGILKFNRPKVLNAFNEELVSETNEVMDRFIKNETVPLPDAWLTTAVIV